MAINVTDANFDEIVIRGSSSQPVLVDFWAAWCGPCKMIGPVLERLESNLKNRFILAKLDTDHNQGTAVKYGISSIPAVKLFINGNVVDEFVGALPEASILAFLEKHLPDDQLQQLIELSRTNPAAAAMQIMESDKQGEKYDALVWAGVLALLSKINEDQQQLDTVRSLLTFLPEFGSSHSDARNMLLSYLADSDSREQLNHFSKIFGSADDIRNGLDYFLENVSSTRNGDREKAKKAILSCFQILGNNSEIVNEYRKRLASILF